MKRRLLNLVTLISLLLFVAVLVLWVWTHSRSQSIRYTNGKGRIVDVISYDGSLHLQHLRGYRDPPWQPKPGRFWFFSGDRYDWQYRRCSANHALIGFRVASNHDVRQAMVAGAGAVVITSNFYALVIPLWFLLSVFLAVPVCRAGAYARRIVSARRKSAGLCGACGYDLTGNVSGVCPECGRGAT
jgi:hypothetical protein